MIRASLRLPEMELPGNFGRWLVRHVVGLTLGSLLVLVTLTVAALSIVRVELTLEAAGIVERSASGELGALLQVPAVVAGQVVAGQEVRIRAPGVGGPGFLSIDGKVRFVGLPEGESAASVPVVVELEDSGDSLVSGGLVQARIIVGQQKASERLLASLKRKGP